MKTIEERAMEYSPEPNKFEYVFPTSGKPNVNIERKAYIVGAKEQKVIDIAKACDWLKENIEGGVHPQSIYGFVEKFRKAMEE